MSVELVRTGKQIKFVDVSIGQLFYAHDAFWTRTSWVAASVVSSSTNHHSNVCNFTIDACDEYVEEVKLA